MPGPAPKNPKVRQRVNKHTTAATIAADPILAMDLPPRDLLSVDGAWHAMTIKWWTDVWDSPMRDEFVKADIHALYRLAMLVDAYWKSELPKDLIALSAEIRLTGQNFGLTPLDRRRLQWTVATTKTAERKAASPAGSRGEDEKPRGKATDPRGFLRAIGD